MKNTDPYTVDRFGNVTLDLLYERYLEEQADDEERAQLGEEALDLAIAREEHDRQVKLEYAAMYPGDAEYGDDHERDERALEA